MLGGSLAGKLSRPSSSRSSSSCRVLSEASSAGAFGDGLFASRSIAVSMRSPVRTSNRMAAGIAPGASTEKCGNPEAAPSIVGTAWRPAKWLSALVGVQDVSHPESMGRSELVELSRSECLHLLATSPVGRVGLNVNDLPAVLPVNFAILDGDVVFRTVEGTKFDAAVTGRVLAFEADGYAPNGLNGWSVLVQGVSSVVSDASELYRAEQLIAEPWAVDGAAARIVRITSTLVSGRLFQRALT